ncbi:MAG: ComF family protein [bacterium]
MSYIKNNINNLLLFLYPKKCMFCDEVINVYEEDFTCKYCKQTIELNQENRPSNISVFDYNEHIRLVILKMKYLNKKQYAKGFAYFMANTFEIENDLDYDIVINVPMYYKKKKKRGYDQAEELAREFSNIVGIKFEPDNLIRNKNTVAQSKVAYGDRKKNVRGIFEIKNIENIKDKNIILVDDVYTSGNTMKQCAITLQKAGANRICYLTLASAGKNK